MSSKSVSWAGGGRGGGHHVLRQAIASRLKPRAGRDLHPSRELSGDVMLDSDWLTTRVTKYSILIGCREPRVLNSDWLPRVLDFDWVPSRVRSLF